MLVLGSYEQCSIAKRAYFACRAADAAMRLGSSIRQSAVISYLSLYDPALRQPQPSPVQPLGALPARDLRPINKKLVVIVPLKALRTCPITQTPRLAAVVRMSPVGDDCGTYQSLTIALPSIRFLQLAMPINGNHDQANHQSINAPTLPTLKLPLIFSPTFHPQLCRTFSVLIAISDPISCLFIQPWIATSILKNSQTHKLRCPNP